MNARDEGEIPGSEIFLVNQQLRTLGFSGQFLTKSRRYSSTFANLRAERAQWREERRHRGVAPPEHTASEDPINADWEVVCIGWANRGETRFADSQWEQRLDEFRAANDDRYTL